MTSLAVFVDHRDMLQAQRDSLGIPPGAWVAGHKKDVVIGPMLNGKEGRVAIYGWHRENGAPIQPVYTGHSDDWVDYSHGIRLVHRQIRVDGEIVDLAAFLEDPARAWMFSPEGVLQAARYPISGRSGGG